MTKWFADVFLPSLFERAGTSDSMWLSRKQTAICVDNMELRAVRFAQFQGDYATHNNYFCEWSGRSVWLSYSKLNGCGTISFGLNAQEQANNEIANELERNHIKVERMERIKANPERKAKRIEKLTAIVAECDEQLAYDDNDKDEVDYYTERRETAQTEIDYYCA